MSDLSDEQADRLESAHATFSRADGAARMRLLAALAADVPPAVPSARKSRIETMKRYAPGAAIAAALFFVVAIGWQFGRPSNAFARVVGAISRAEGFRCDLSIITPGPADTEKAEQVSRVYWLPSGEERVDHWILRPSGKRDDDPGRGKPDTSLIYRPGHDGLRLDHDTKRYRAIPKSAAREFSFGLFGGLGAYRGKAEPMPGPEEIRGVNAEGFTIPWSTLVVSDTREDARVQVWIDPATSLPVRVDLIGMVPGGAPVVRFDDFRWGPQDPAIFDTSPPAGYAKKPVTDIKADEITQYVKDGLSTFAKYNNGRYPAVTYVYGDEQGEALRTLMGMPPDAVGWALSEDPDWRDAKEGEFSHGSYGLSWINMIQRDFPEGAYNGKTVTPEDASKVLVRWKLDDGDYQVIFGDLSSETVSPTRLRELESR